MARVLIGNFKGPKGDKGDKGDTGSIENLEENLKSSETIAEINRNLDDYKNNGYLPKNMLNDKNNVSGQYISVSGKIETETKSNYTELIEVEPNKNYTFSGKSTRSGGNKRVHAYDSNGNWIKQLGFASDVTEGSNFEINITTTNDTKYVRLSYFISDTDTQFERGSKTNYVPYFQPVSDINASLGVLGKCKNLLNPTLQTTTTNGVTCTNNGDGTYTLNGTSSAQTTFILKTINDLPTGKYILLSNSIYISAYLLKSDGAWVKTLSGGDIFEITSTNSKIRVVIFVDSGKSLSNEIVKPMVTTNLNATADDFVPYTGDGDTLTEDVAGIKSDLGGLSFSVSGTTLSITDGTNTWTLSQ